MDTFISFVPPYNALTICFLDCVKVGESEKAVKFMTSDSLIFWIPKAAIQKSHKGVEGIWIKPWFKFSGHNADKIVEGCYFL